MNRARMGLIFFALVTLIGFQPLYGQDLTLHETTSSTGMMGSGNTNGSRTTYFTAKAIKTSSADGNDVIIRLDEGKIITIDNKQKTYSEVTVRQLNEMFAKMTNDMGKSPEEMEMVRKMMGQMASSFTVTKEGPGESIAGYATEKYLMKGPMEMEIWATPDLKMPALYYDALKMRMPQNPMFDMSKLYDEMKKVNGMTLKTVMTMKMMNMEMKTTTVVTSVEKGSVPESIFQIPAGYKSKPMTMK